MNPGWHLLALEVIDYFVQAVLLVLGFVYPWIVRRGRGWRVWYYPLTVAFFWGIWRMALFDPVFANDVPGIGYLVVGVMHAMIGSAFYGLRRFFTRPTTPSAATHDT